jgi:hypothetical protein
MAASKTSIISYSVSLIGHAPVTTLEDADDLVISAEQSYDMNLPNILSMANWRFATQIAQLSQLVETPPPQYKKIYQLPSGFLKNLRLHPNVSKWDIFENSKIYTDFDGDLYMEYIFKPDESKFPNHFQRVIAFAIASELALSNAEKVDYYSALQNGYNKVLAEAAAIEAQNRPNFYMQDFPMLTKRFIAGNISNTTVS